MKLKKLNKALVAAGLVAGAAISMPSQAVVMSDDGTGEVLIYPFYTVQGPSGAPRTTVFTINNTTADYKAVKIRFHEAHNSRDALDFNLYLSPNDVWTGGISRNAEGVAQLLTSDTTCTIPSSVMVNSNTFSTLAYTQDSNNDGGNQNPIRTNEGYVEVIEMGVVDPDQTILTTGEPPLGVESTIVTLGDAIMHVNDIPGGALNPSGIPVGCEALQATAATGGVWAIGSNGGSLDATHDAVSQPTGGLAGSAMVLQAAAGTVAAYNATALKHFYDVAGPAVCDLGPGIFADAANGTYCETNGQGNAATTTNRAFDDLHSFKDLDPSTANARSIQTYPNLAMAFPQISTVYDPDGTNAGIVGAGTLTTLEWSANEAVSSGITSSKDNVLFASLQDTGIPLFNDATPAVNVVPANCGGFNGTATGTVAAGACANARPVSAVLAVNNLINEYVLEADAAAGIDFRTDIVTSFPTKWYFSDNGLYDAETDTVTDGTTGVSQLEVVNVAPFSSQFVSSGVNRDQACEPFSINQNSNNLVGGIVGGIWNREEAAPNVDDGGLVPSPAINVTNPGNSFCQESNVISLNDGDLLTSRIANGLDATVGNSDEQKNAFNIDFPAGFKSGTFDIAFDIAGVHQMTSVVGPMATAPVGSPDYGIANVAGTVTGLPAVGFVVEGLVVGSDAFQGNFTVALPHKTR